MDPDRRRFAFSVSLLFISLDFVNALKFDIRIRNVLDFSFEILSEEPI